MSSELKIPDYPESVLISSRKCGAGNLRTSSYIVFPKGEPLFSEQATYISVDDEGGGSFLVISQFPNLDAEQKVRIDFSEWGLICEAVNKLHKEWVVESN